MSPSSPTQTSAEDLEELLEFERLISELSSRFVNLAPAEVDQEIEDSLRRVCEPLGIDYGVLWEWSAEEPSVITATHVYPPQQGLLSRESLSHELFPWVEKQIRAGRTVVLPSVEEMPAEAAFDLENARRRSIRSNLTLPLSSGGEPVGALALATLRAPRDWPDALVRRLRLVGQVFTNALARRRSELKLGESEARLSAGVDLAGLGFYEVDYGESTAFFDARLRALLGFPPQGGQGLELVELFLERVHADDRSHFLEQREQLHDARLKQTTVEYRYLHPTAGETWMHHVARVATRDAEGRARETYGVLRDITERRQREEQLRRSLAEIEQLKDRLQAESDYLKAEVRGTHATGEITGQSPAIQKVLRLVEQVAPTDSTVLVLGETGTGKELVAQAIHRLSHRKNRLMVKVNCAALPSGLIESELFGREKGAFTGALTRQAGRFDIADGSTLFLDEIGELPLDLQAKLLRVLEAGEFERLGSPRTIKVDVRVIAATNRNLAEEVHKGRFRSDLFYRLNVFPIRVPPLRERAEDIPLLVWALLEELCSRMGRKITQVPRKTMEALQCRPWPGNVRELRNLVEHGVILTTGGALRVPMLDEASPEAPAAQTLADAEREHIVRALERAGWHVKGPRGAAATLGLKPATLYSRMKKLGIQAPGPRADGSA